MSIDKTTRDAAEAVIRFGSPHCCVCTGICGHVGPIRLCDRHAEMDRVPSSRRR